MRCVIPWHEERPKTFGVHDLGNQIDASGWGLRGVYEQVNYTVMRRHILPVELFIHKLNVLISEVVKPRLT